MNLCRIAIALGFDDITLSGGEPLLRKEVLCQLLDHIGGEYAKKSPAVTIVTNGALLDRSTISKLADYPGSLKLNLSLHAVDPEAYRTIIGGREAEPRKILGNVSRAARAGIEVKLNCVLLKGLNHTHDNLLAFIRAASSAGARCVKFLELLVERDKPRLYDYFYSAEAVYQDLRSAGFLYVGRLPRRRILRHPNFPGLDVEVQQCTCKFGCKSCRQFRDRTFGQDLRYYPCFVQSRRGISFRGKSELKQALTVGDRQLAIYARKYGDNSPILIPQDKYVKKRQEVFFETPLAFSQCQDLLMQQGFRCSYRRDFILHYWWPRRSSPEWTGFRHILKYGWDEHTPNKIQRIESFHTYHRQDQFLISDQQFKSDSQPPAHPSMRLAERWMTTHHFRRYMTCRFLIHDFTKGRVQLSVDDGNSGVSVKVSADCLGSPLLEKALRALKAVPILIPHTEWLHRRHSRH